MRIAFLNGPTQKFKVSRDSRWPERSKSGTLYYPIWLAYATGYAKKEGHKVLLLDAEAGRLNVKEVRGELEKFSPDMLVMSVTTPTFKNDIENVNYLGKLDAEIVLVGTHVSAVPELPFKLSKRVDFVARGEYDRIIVELAGNIENPRRVKGITYKAGSRIKNNQPAELIKTLDEIPWVSPIYKEYLNLNHYAYALALKPMVQIFTSRGCPNMCTFCQYPQVFSGRKFRTRSPDDVVNELEWIKKKMPEVKEIFIEDDTFTINKPRVHDICKKINEKNLKLTWSSNVRADLDYDTMKVMKSAGARLLVVGYESGDDKILKNIKKGIVTYMSKAFSENARKAGLKVFGCFMIGLPGETKETMEKTFSLAKELDPDMAFFQQAVPFPGTEMYNWAKKEGHLKADEFSKWYNESGHFDFILDYPQLGSDEIEKTRNKFMKQFYMRPSFILKTLARNITNPSELSRIARAGINYIGFLRRL